VRCDHLLYNECPCPVWKLPKFDSKLKIELNAAHIFGENKERILSVLPHLSEDEVLKWFSEELPKRIELVKVFADSTVHPHWYSTKQHVGFLLPMFYKDQTTKVERLVLTAAIEKKDFSKLDMMRGQGCHTTSDIENSQNPQNEIYNIVTVLLPEWAYNNARILGVPKQGWLQDFGKQLGEKIRSTNSRKRQY